MAKPTSPKFCLYNLRALDFNWVPHQTANIMVGCCEDFLLSVNFCPTCALYMQNVGVDSQSHK